jgi:hypothetical protein
MNSFTHIKMVTSIRNNVWLGYVVSIAAHYGLEGPGIKSPWKQDFECPSRLARRLTQPPVQWVTGVPGSKAAGVWC